MKQIVDALDAKQAVLMLPFALLLTYGALRAANTLFAELRDIVFVRVAKRAIRRVALQVFRHLHSLSLRFHLDRQTGGVSRDIERGTRGISTLLSYMLFSIIPVVLEFGLVAAVLLSKFDWRFAAITAVAVVAYLAFTFTVTEWRMEIRRRANELDSKANSRAIDSLLNYETVKYFNNEEFEARRYDENLRKFENAEVRNEASLGLLNIGQSLIIAVAVTLLMVLAGAGGGAGQADPGRPGAGQRPADTALHPAQLPGHGVSRNQAGADRHGQNVPAARGAPRGAGSPRRARICRPVRPAVRFEHVGFQLRERRGRSCST